MNKIIAATAAFLTVAFFAVSANAVTVLNGGGTYIIAAGDSFVGDVKTGRGGAGSWQVTFNAASPLFATTTAQIGVTNFSNFSNLVVSWISVATNNVLGSAAITAGSTILSTVFNNPNNLSQYLRFSWDVSPRTGGFDIVIHDVAAVPLPAGFLLMGTALAGLGVISRRRKKKLAA